MPRNQERRAKLKEILERRIAWHEARESSGLKEKKSKKNKDVVKALKDRLKEIEKDG